MNTYMIEHIENLLRVFLISNISTQADKVKDPRLCRGFFTLSTSVDIFDIKKTSRRFYLLPNTLILKEFKKNKTENFFLAVYIVGFLFAY